MDDVPASAARADGRATMETRITDIVRLGVIGLIAYWSYVLVAPFILIVVWAAILTAALNPFYDWLRTLLRGGSRRGGSSSAKAPPSGSTC